MNISGRLDDFLAEYFPSGALQPPRLEGLPFLRFELGGERDPWYRVLSTTRTFDLPGRLSRRRRRIAQAVDRAIALFEAAFEPDHRGFLDAYWWPGEAADDEGRQLIALLPEALRHRTERNAGVNFWGGPDGDDDAFARVAAALAPRQLDYESLFRLVARHELGLEPSLAARAYIVNESEPVIFLMYDDRGAIVHAPTAERLRPLYERFGDWLVDEWRPQMDAIFAQR